MNFCRYNVFFGISLALVGICHPSLAQTPTEIAPWQAERQSLNIKMLNPSLLEREKSELPELATSDDVQDPDKPTLSSIETMYSGRLIEPPEQFGYDLFNNSGSAISAHTPAMPSGAIQDDFILGIGDELDIVMRGQKQLQLTAQITSEGLLIVEDLDPIPAAGRSIGQVRTQLESLSSQRYNTKIFLSLAKVKQVSVLIAGHVRNPGKKTLTAFDSVLDALIAAGGIDKGGTLRQIKIIRDGTTVNLDLYSLLIYGNDSADFNLRNGDKIMVPPLGPTVAVAGGVKRPAIYEILPALNAKPGDLQRPSQRLSAYDLLNMSGGLLSTAQNRLLRMGMDESGAEVVEDVTDSQRRIFSDGDIFMVERSKERREGMVELKGAAHSAGLYSIEETKTLSSLLSREQRLPPDAYPLIGIIERWNTSRLARELIAFPPMLVIEGDYDRKLKEGDIVHLLTRKQIENMQQDKPDESASLFSNKDQPFFLDPLLAEFLQERSVFVRGAVRKPGAYPVSAGATLESLFAVAGGPTLDANLSSVEITRTSPTDAGDEQKPYTKRENIDLKSIPASTVGLGAGDTVRINQKYRRVEDSHILIIGEVRNPGTYDIMPGDTLSSVIGRSGGLTSEAYAEGTIFSRNSERMREEARFKAQARDLEMRLAAMMEETDEKKKPSAGEMGAVRDLITQLRQAEGLGRITVEADPDTLALKPELDPLLESGDRIYIPKRPSTVRVAGEVLSPAALQYRTRMGARDYITQAGGYAYGADTGRVFIVYPNGSARPVSAGNWGANRSSGSSDQVPPGSTIVVPRDPKPFDFMDTAKDLTQILANLATTAIFASAVGED